MAATAGRTRDRTDGSADAHLLSGGPRHFDGGGTVAAYHSGLYSLVSGKDVEEFGDFQHWFCGLFCFENRTGIDPSLFEAGGEGEHDFEHGGQRGADFVLFVLDFFSLRLRAKRRKSG